MFCICIYIHCFFALFYLHLYTRYALGKHFLIIIILKSCVAGTLKHTVVYFYFWYLHTMSGKAENIYLNQWHYHRKELKFIWQYDYIYSIYIERENKKNFLGTLNATKKKCIILYFFLVHYKNRHKKNDMGWTLSALHTTATNVIFL